MVRIGGRPTVFYHPTSNGGGGGLNIRHAYAQFAARIRGGGPQLEQGSIAAEFFDQELDPALLFETDREACVKLVLNAPGRHQQIIDSFMGERKDKFIGVVRAVFEGCAKEVNSTVDFHLMVRLIGLYCRNRVDAQLTFLEENDLGAIFIEAGSAKARFPVFEEFGEAHSLADFILGRADQNRLASLWGQLSDQARKAVHQYFPKHSARAEAAWDPSWGEAPSGEKLDIARSFSRRMREEDEAAKLDLDNLIGMRSPRVASEMIEEQIDLRALFGVDRELALIAFGYARGTHYMIAEQLENVVNEQFVKELLTAILKGEGLISGDDLGWVYYLNSVKQFAIEYSDGVRDAIDFIKNNDLDELYIKAAERVSLEEDRDQFFDRAERLDIHEFSKLFLPESHGSWNPAWGEEPSEEKQQFARQFVASVEPAKRTNNPGLAEEACRRNINLDALWLVDQELCYQLVIGTAGYHHYIVEELSQPVLTELLRRWFKEEEKNIAEGRELQSVVSVASVLRDYFEMDIMKVVEYLHENGFAPSLLKFATVSNCDTKLIDLAEFMLLQMALREGWAAAWSEVPASAREVLTEMFPNRAAALNSAASSASVDWAPAWGEAPEAKEMARARAWAVEARKKEELKSSATSFDALEAKLDLRALLMVDPELFKIVLGNSIGLHAEMIALLHSNNPDFIAFLMKAMLSDELTAAETPKELGRYVECFYILWRESGFDGQFIVDRGLVGPLFRQLPIITGHMAGFRGQEIVNLVREIMSAMDQSAWQALPADLRLALQVNSYVDDLVTKLEKPAWNEAWGVAPTDEEIAATKQWAKQVRLDFADLADNRLGERLEKSRVRINWLYFVDPELALIVTVYTAGRHKDILRTLEVYDDFRALIFDGLLSKAREFYQQGNSAEAKKYSSAVLHYLIRINMSLEELFEDPDFSLNLIDVAMLTGGRDNPMGDSAFFEHILWSAIERNDREFFRQLTPEARQKLLADSEYSDLAAQLRDLSTDVSWNPAWGKEPDQRLIDQAQKFLSEYQDRPEALHTREAAEDACLRRIDYGALYFLDPEAAIALIGNIKGWHDGVFRDLSSSNFSQQFRLEILKRLVYFEPAGSIEEKARYLGMALYMIYELAKNKKENVEKVLEEAGIREQFVAAMLDKEVAKALDRNTTGFMLFIEFFPLALDEGGVRRARPVRPEKTDHWTEAMGPRPAGEMIAAAKGLKTAQEVYEGKTALPALFLANHELLVKALGNSQGHHGQLALELKQQPPAFIAAVIGSLLEGKYLDIEDSYQLARFAHSANQFLCEIFQQWETMACFLFEHDLALPLLRFVEDRESMEALSEIFAAKNSEEMLQLARAVFKQATLNGKAKEVLSWFDGDSLARFEEMFPAEIKGLLATQAQGRGMWDERWGKAPSDEDILRAKDFSGQIREAGLERGPEVASEAVKNGIDLCALYLADHELFVAVTAFTSGRHEYVARVLRGQSELFLANVIGSLVRLQYTDLNNDREAGFYLYSANQILLEFFSQQPMRAGQFLFDNGLTFNWIKLTVRNDDLLDAIRREIRVSPRVTENIVYIACFACMAANEQGKGVEIWESLDQATRDYLKSTRHLAIKKMEADWQAAQKPALIPRLNEIMQGLLSQISKFDAEEWNDIAYSRSATEAFFSLQPETQLPVMVRMIEEHPEQAGLIVRSAVGLHAPISKMVNQLPTELATSLIVGELKLTPEEIASDAALKQKYRDLDNFGALKCCFEMKVNGGASVHISPVWDSLSIEGKVEFFRNFRLYCLVVREMFTELLVTSFAAKMNNLSPAEISALRQACPPEVNEFLKFRGIIDLDAPVDEGNLPAEPVEAPRAWEGKVPKPKDKVAAFLAKVADLPVENWGTVPYSLPLQDLFAESFTAEEQPVAFKMIWQANPEAAAILIRTMKFHDNASNMLSALDDRQLVHLLNATVIGLPAGFKDETLQTFDRLDSGAVARGLWLLLESHEERSGLLNQLPPLTLARILDQSYVVSERLEIDRRRTYLRAIIINILGRPEIDREKLAAALAASSPETACWIKKLFKGELDMLAARAGAENAFAGDQEAVRLTSSAIDQNSALELVGQLKPLAEQLKLLQGKRPGFTELAASLDADLPAAIVEIGQLWDNLQANENMAAVFQVQSYLDSRELFLIRKIADKLADWAAELIFKGEVGLPANTVLEGEATALLTIVDEHDEGRLLMALSNLEPFNAVVSRRYPTRYSDTTNVRAMLTSHGGTQYDHDTIKAKNSGAILARLPGAVRLLRPFNNRWVTITLGEKADIRLASEPEIKAVRQRLNLLEVDQTEMGPKGEKIVDLVKRGFPVPGREYLPASLDYDLYNKLGLFEAIPRILGDNPFVEGDKGLRERLGMVRQLITQARVPEEIVAELLKKNSVLSGTARIFRPILPFEDTARFTAAGYMDSPVSSSEEEAVVQAILAGWSSYWNLEPFVARKKNGLGHFDHLPGGVLMELIVARAAGVMIAGPKEIVISAVPGQGQGAVQEGVPADIYTFKTDDLDFLGHRPVQSPRTTIFVYNNGRIEKNYISEDEGAKPAVTFEEARNLALQGRALFKVYGPQPRDVEWAVGGDSRLWIVQDRDYLPKG